MTPWAVAVAEVRKVADVDRRVYEEIAKAP
jgi:hypothetical protein